MTNRRLTLVPALCVIAAAALLGVAVWHARQLESSAAPVTYAPRPAAASASDATTPFVPTPAQVEMAVAIITDPDEGETDLSYRFTGPEVTYRLELGWYPAEYVTKVRAAFAYAGQVTGLRVVEVAGDADIAVTTKSGNGAYTQLWPNQDGSINHVQLQLGCCRDRPVWEDVLQSFGPAGDHGDSNSIFSQDVLGLQAPSAFDTWVLRLLYSLPPGSTPAQVRAAALTFS